MNYEIELTDMRMQILKDIKNQEIRYYYVKLINFLMN